jgi:hypothetical protein
VHQCAEDASRETHYCNTLVRQASWGCRIVTSDGSWIGQGWVLSGLLPSFTRSGPMSRAIQRRPSSRLPHGIEWAAWARENLRGGAHRGRCAGAGRAGGGRTGALQCWVSPIFDGAPATLMTSSARLTTAQRPLEIDACRVARTTPAPARLTDACCDSQNSPSPLFLTPCLWRVACSWACAC